MAKTTRKGGRASARSRTRSRRQKSAKGNGNGGARNDAIALLKADHREVESLFEQFEKSRSDERKAKIAEKICTALKIHTTIEEEIFYPAFLEATEDKEIHHEAEVEHAGAKNLIAQIESADATDEYYDAKVTVLKEMIKHHVNEEEQRGGMFAKARESEMDLKAIGEQLRERKQELMSEGEAEGMESPASRARTGADERYRTQRESTQPR
jgi:hypothetical protein